MKQTLQYTIPHADKVAAAGNRLYEAGIKQRVEREHRGNFLVIDTESGDFAVSPTEDAALKELELRRRPPCLPRCRALMFWYNVVRGCTYDPDT